MNLFMVSFFSCLLVGMFAAEYIASSAGVLLLLGVGVYSLCLAVGAMVVGVTGSLLLVRHSSVCLELLLQPIDLSRWIPLHHPGQIPYVPVASEP